MACEAVLVRSKGKLKGVAGGWQEEFSHEGQIGTIARNVRLDRDVCVGDIRVKWHPGKVVNLRYVKHRGLQQLQGGVRAHL